MYHIKQDQRSIRSAETIYDALARLITKQSMETIKVSELVEQAQVGRATFYRNFYAVEDVLRWRCDQIVDELVVYIVEYGHSQQVDSIMPLVKPVLRFFYLHSSIVELLIAAKRIDILQVALQKKMETGRRMFALPNVPAKYLAYSPILRSSAAVHVLAHWVQNGKQEPSDALADGLVEMVGQMSRLGILL